MTRYLRRFATFAVGTLALTALPDCTPDELPRERTGEVSQGVFGVVSIRRGGSESGSDLCAAPFNNTQQGEGFGIYACNSGDVLQRYLRDGSLLRLEGTNLCLQANPIEGYNPTKALCASSNTHQQWSEDQGRIKSASNWCLGRTGTGTGTWNLRDYACTTGDEQQWTLLTVPYVVGLARGGSEASADLCAAPFNNTQQGEGFGIVACNSGDVLQRFIRDGSLLRLEGTNLCLRANPTEGNNPTKSLCSPTDTHQQWSEDQGRIKSASNWCLGRTGTGTGTWNFRNYACTTGDAQQWVMDNWPWSSTPPGKPQCPHAQATNNFGVRITWSRPPRSGAGNTYDVYRDTTTLLGNVAGTEYYDTGVTDTNDHTWTIKAKNGSVMSMEAEASVTGKESSAARVPINTCAILDTENTEYYLTADVSSPGTCFKITANNITLDLNGKTVRYDTQTGPAITNFNFESGTTGWTLPTSPTGVATVIDNGTYASPKVEVWSGDRSLRWKLPVSTQTVLGPTVALTASTRYELSVMAYMLEPPGGLPLPTAWAQLRNTSNNQVEYKTPAWTSAPHRGFAQYAIPFKTGTSGGNYRVELGVDSGSDSGWSNLEDSDEHKYVYVDDVRIFRNVAYATADRTTPTQFRAASAGIVIGAYGSNGWVPPDVSDACPGSACGYGSVNAGVVVRNGSVVQGDDPSDGNDSAHAILIHGTNVTIHGVSTTVQGPNTRNIYVRDQGPVTIVGGTHINNNWVVANRDSYFGIPIEVSGVTNGTKVFRTQIENAPHARP